VTPEEVALWREEAFWTYFAAVSTTVPYRPATPALVAAVEEYERACKAYAVAVH
jgi:hypothetical protein